MPKVELAIEGIFSLQLNTSEAIATLASIIEIYRYFRITYDIFRVVFIPESIFSIFEIVFNLLYRELIESPPFRSELTDSNTSELSAILCKPCSQRNPPPYTRGLLGYLLGFWPSGPKPLRGQQHKRGGHATFNQKHLEIVSRWKTHILIISLL